MTSDDRCPGCGAALPDDPNGPHHRYMIASSGCWEAFGEILAAEFSRPGWGREHRLTVDTYAAQHPGEDGRKQRQSVAIHLVALCHRLEHDLDTKSVLAATRSMTTEKREWPHLTAPRAYSLTVIDALKSTSAEEHPGFIYRWAEATWAAWSNHHATVRAWADDALRAVGRA